MLALPVAARMYLPCEREQQRHGVIAHRVAIDAAAVGKAHAPIAQRVEAEAVVTRPAYLDEAGVRGAFEHRVGPEPGHHQHVALGDPGQRVLPAPGLEVRDPGPAQREPLGETIRDVGEVDDEGVVGRKTACCWHQDSPWWGLRCRAATGFVSLSYRPLGLTTKWLLLPSRTLSGSIVNAR